eukprot:697589-Pyramimonas_sp.AAC.1
MLVPPWGHQHRALGRFWAALVKARARQTPWPLQTGCFSPLGAEATIHAVRLWCDWNASDSRK